MNAHKHHPIPVPTYTKPQGPRPNGDLIEGEYLLSQGDKIPIAWVYLTKKNYGHAWVVPECPFCFRQHLHMAGQHNQNPRSFLGVRVPHCISPPADTYYLVELVSTP